MKRSAQALALLLALAALARAQGDEVLDQIETARKSYEAGQYRPAIDALNFAIAKIQEQMAAHLARLLPEPLPGWKADAPEAQTGGLATMIAGTSLSRRYWRDDGANVVLNILADSPLLSMLTAALSMPLIMQSNPNMKPYAFRGQRGLLEHAPGSQDYTLTLLIGGRLVIEAKGQGLTDPKPLDAYLERLDLDAVRAALTP
ncbi:hypothetical protein GWK36_05195 [Caldichromatium japonicum]|uniref:Uncharacterized protein n=1 Tax=Caldichromatium japonicum TaxID=2699430 RepID=A0A6G7VBM0_9GAMM|nr:hypothetical protein [Caldichromatium japonicum]QIK37473.1 hypothetical protein GWK36_05195 [Caldichromatium japonicum]